MPKSSIPYSHKPRLWSMPKTDVLYSLKPCGYKVYQKQAYFITTNSGHRWVSFKPYTKGNAWWSSLHILPHYALCKQVNFVKLYIFDTKHKINTYNEYLTRSDKCVSIWSWPPSARRITWLKPSYKVRQKQAYFIATNDGCLPCRITA